MHIHELKTWPEFFQFMLEGTKTFEVRKNERNFAVGDTLVLLEWIPCKECGGTGRCWDVGDKCTCGTCGGEGTLNGYTGRRCSVTVTYILENSPALKEGYCVLGCKPLIENAS